MNPRSRRLGACLLPIWVLASILRLSAQSVDWAKEISELARSGRVDQAMTRTQAWLQDYPNDLDARAWHARIIGWQGHLDQSEREFRSLFREVPGDIDILIGLAHVLNLRNKHQEALELLHGVCGPAGRPDCRAEEAHTLTILGRQSDARSLYQGLINDVAYGKEARTALDGLREEGRHEFLVGGESDLLSYSQDAGAVTAALKSRWSDHWQTAESVTEYRRFGTLATGVEANMSYRLSHSDAVSFGAGFAGNSGVAPSSSVSVGYDHAFAWSTGPVRGLEAMYDQKWIRYPGTRILTYSPAALLTFPKSVDFLVRVTTAEIQDRSVQGWTPAIQTRITFPMNRRLRGQVLFGSGAENFGTVDQIQFRSSRIAGAGVTVRLFPGQEFRTTYSYEAVSGNRSLAVFGGAYAYRF